MSLLVRFQGGAFAGKVASFGSDQTRLTFGRAADRNIRCPEENTRVGRNHCELHRVGDSYRVHFESKYAVFIDGERVDDGHEISATCTMRLGPDGGQLFELELQEDRGLRTTEDQGAPRPGVRTQLRGIARATRRNLRLALVVFTVLGVAGTWFATHQSEVLRIQQLTVEELRAKYDKAAVSTRLREALRAAKRSVYLVALRSEEGFQPGATAWVVGENRLATNAHVAGQFAELPPDVAMIVRSPGSPPRDFVVERATIHPGYGEFRRLARSQCAQSEGLRGQKRDVVFIDGCDVALLHVRAGAAPLDPPLAVASTEELGALQVGDPIGFVGYPMEGLVGVLEPKAPDPAVQMGHVVGLTDFFFEADVEKSRQLVKHNIPATGGASGSPIVNADGKVIALLSGGNVEATFSGGRTPNAALVNFAQRVDLLSELLTDEAGSIQPSRSREWQARLDEYATCRLESDEFWIKNEADWADQIAPATSARLLEDTMSLTVTDARADAPAKLFVGRTEIPLPAPGPYRMLAYAPEGMIQLAVHDVETDTMLGSDLDTFWWAQVDIDLDTPRTVALIVQGPQPLAHAEVRILGRRELSRDQVLAQIEARFAEITGRTPTLLDRTTGELGSGERGGASRYRVPLGSSGLYLITALTRDREDIDLYVSLADAQAPAVDEALDWHPAVVVKTQAPEADVLVLGPAAGIGFELLVYTVGEP